MKKSRLFVSTLLLLAYPLYIYIGLNHFSVRYIAFFILALFMVRCILTIFLDKNILKHSIYRVIPEGRLASRPYRQTVQIIRPYFFIALIGILFSGLGAIFNNLLMIKLYPVMISLILLSSFYYSLLYPPTIITRIAQSLEKKPLSTAIIAYTRKVTITWCMFFIINATISFYTAVYSSTAVWSLYNGLLSYLFMGLLFVSEWIIRYFVKKRTVRAVAS